jgi:hypothetical protein
MIQCPFCFSFLKKSIHDFHVGFHCDNVECMMSGEMPRYHENYEKDYPLIQDYLIAKIFCLDDLFYIKIDFKRKQTVVYKFDIVLLVDPVIIDQVVDFNLEELDSVRKRVRMIATFS